LNKMTVLSYNYCTMTVFYGATIWVRAARQSG
jgi:hypothetical protein